MTLFSTLARSIRRHLFVFLVVFLIAGLAAVYVAATREQPYESTSTVTLLPTSDPASAALFYGAGAQNLLATYSQLFESQTFLRDVGASLDPPLSPGEVDELLDVSSSQSAPVLKITGSSSSAVLSQQVSRVAADRFLNFARSSTLIEPQLIQSASLPRNRRSSPVVAIGAAGLIFSLILAGAAALALDRIRPRLNEATDAA